MVDYIGLDEEGNGAAPVLRGRKGRAAAKKAAAEAKRAKKAARGSRGSKKVVDDNGDVTDVVEEGRRDVRASRFHDYNVSIGTYV